VLGEGDGYAVKGKKGTPGGDVPRAVLGGHIRIIRVFLQFFQHVAEKAPCFVETALLVLVKPIKVDIKNLVNGITSLLKENVSIALIGIHDQVPFWLTLQPGAR
jgi:hypothetical protein